MKSLLLSVLLILGVSFSLSAQKAQKAISKSYDVSKTFDLSIENKYGEIKVLNWTKNVVDVQVEIIVEAASQAKADELLSGIDVAVSEGTDMASFITRFNEKEGWKDKTNVQVNYTVNLPEWVNADLKNKYGNLFIQTLSGKVKVDVAYGSFQIGTLSRGSSEPVNSVRLAYGEGTIENAGWLNVVLAYSNLTVNNSSSINIQSEYSKLFTEKADVLAIKGKYDKYAIGEVSTLQLETKYSGLSVTKLYKSITLKSSYTGTKIDLIAGSVNSVNAEISYGNFKAGLEKGASFNVDCKVKYGELSLPSASGLTYNKDENESSAKGRIGSASAGELKVNLSYGNLEIN
ncbi:MAG: hypothetical protein ACOYXB_16085 [Bacteroidota bacterium]